MRKSLCGLIAASTLGLAAVPAHAATHTPTTTQYKVKHDILTAHTELDGTVRFTTPDGWRATNDAAHHTFARFTASGEGACALRLTVNARGVATRNSITRQIINSSGISPYGRGDRSHGAWGTYGPLLSGGEGEPPLAGAQGTSVVKIAARRYVHLSVYALLAGCAADSADAQATLAPGSPEVLTINHVLAHIRPDVSIRPLERS